VLQANRRLPCCERIENRIGNQNISVTGLTQVNLLISLIQEGRDQKRVAAGFAFVTPEARALVSVPVFVNKRRAPRSVLEPRGALTEYE